MKKMRKLGTHCLQVVSFLLVSYCATAADIEQEKAQLQVDVEALGRDVAVVEKNVLVPANSRVEVFLSLVSDVKYTPQSVTLTVDGNNLTSHTYTASDIAALRLGALHPLWQGSLPSGTHQLQVSFTGLNRKDKPVQNEAKLDFEKGSNHRSLELKITSAEEGDVAVFSVKDWGDKE